MSVDPGEKQTDTSSESAAVPRVKTLACLGGVSLERGVEEGDLHEYLREVDNTVWVDIQDPGPEELSMLLEEFSVHPLALEDVSRGQQRSKVIEYKSHLFVVMYAAVPHRDVVEFETSEVHLFIGRNYLVSIHRGPSSVLDEAAARWTRGGQLLREGVGFLVYTVLDAIIDSYFPLLDAIKEEMDDNEMDIFSRLQQDDVQRLLRLKRTLVALRRALSPLRETFTVFLRREHSFVTANTRVYFHDVYDHVLRILDILEIEREMVASTMEASLTVASNRLNRSMKTLTIITVCVAIVGSIFSAWGMNFHEIPLANTPAGFWIVMGATVMLIGVMGAVWRWNSGRRE
jgi:magnesium transporter